MKYLLSLVCIFINSCIWELPVGPVLEIDPHDTNPLNASSKLYMNGVYKVIKGIDIFGEEVAGKWVNNKWCFYSGHDVVYSENMGGFSNDTIQFNGYYRVVRSGSGSKLYLNIYPDEGGTALLSDTIPAEIIIRSHNYKFEFKRIRSLYEDPSFHILAHRGGGRNSERLGYSENSIPMIRHSEILGATGVELDVKATRDGKLILFHDNTFSPRTVRGSYLLGRVGNFTLEQIQALGKLIYGESIPTLKDALDFIIDSTSLSLVWLDIKEPGVVNETIRIQIAANQRAAVTGRDLRILLGIPTNEILEAYNKSPFKDQADVLIELSEYEAASVSTCRVWAPRWTIVIPENSTRPYQVFTWTLDLKEYIADRLYNNKVNGILSNYPSLVAGMHYTRE